MAQTLCALSEPLTSSPEPLPPLPPLPYVLTCSVSRHLLRRLPMRMRPKLGSNAEAADRLPRFDQQVFDNNGWTAADLGRLEYLGRDYGRMLEAGSPFYPRSDEFYDAPLRPDETHMLIRCLNVFPDLRPSIDDLLQQPCITAAAVPA